MKHIKHDKRHIKELKKKLSYLKQSLELMEDILEEKENDLKPEIEKFKTKIKELSEYQIDPDRVNIKLFKLENHSRSCSLRIGGVKETSNGEWEKCEEYLETLLQDELGIEENIIIERAHRTTHHLKVEGANQELYSVTFIILQTK